MKWAAMKSGARLVDLGDGKYRLANASGETLGWIRGRTVGVGGFASVAEAVEAAPRLRRLADGILRRAYGRRYRLTQAVGELELVHDGAYEWIAVANVPVARLVRGPTAGLPNGRVGLELVLPSYASEEVAIAVAEALGLREKNLGFVRHSSREEPEPAA